MKRSLVAVMIFLVATCLVSLAVASPRAVVADYFRDGVIDHAYSIDDLRGALVFAEQRQGAGAQYTAFADAVNQAITANLVGSAGAAQAQLTSPRTRTAVVPSPQPPESVPAGGGLPTPPSGAPTTETPLAVPIMAIAAGMLVIAGIGASVWRRLRR